MATEKTVQKSSYNSWYWYPYIDEETGKERGLTILPWVYKAYYEPGYLTDQLIEDMVNGKEISFEIPDGAITRTITAKLIPYINKQGNNTKIIEFKGSSKISDKNIIINNAEKIAVSYWDDKISKFNYIKPQAVVDKLNLSKVWKTFATNEKILDKKYGTIKVYRANARKHDEDVYLYCEVDLTKNECIMITEEQLKAAKQKETDQLHEAAEKKRLLQEHIKSIKKPYHDYINNFISDYNAASSKVNYLDSITSGITINNIDSLVIGYISSKKDYDEIRKFISDYNNRVHYVLYSNDELCIKELEEVKLSFLRKLKIYTEYLKIKYVRTELLNQYRKDGLESMTDGVDVDLALDLGRFKEIQKILVRYGNGAPEYIIKNLYLDIIDKVDLKEKLLNMLKVYHDFYDMPEKDRQSIAKFIAKHKLKDYYDRISKYDDVLETLISNSRDPKLLKPILTGIAGTSRADILKRDKTYYFETRARLKDDILLYKPIELVEELRTYIKVFNLSSDVAILTNIELDSDESFVFQFYTFTDDADTKDFDGRRVKHLTRLYNLDHPTKKIGFNHDK